MCVLVEEICGSDPVSCDECLTGVRRDNNEYVDTTTSTSTMGDDETRGEWLRAGVCDLGSW